MNTLRTHPLRELLLVLLVGSLAALPAVATRTTYDYDPEFDFSTLKSFAWKPRVKTTRMERINPLAVDSNGDRTPNSCASGLNMISLLYCSPFGVNENFLFSRIFCFH